MTTPYLLADLMHDEGLKLEAYPDPETGGSPWTIGYGHTGLDVHPGLVWTTAQAEQALITDVVTVKTDLDRFLPWWRGLADARQDCLVNMAFNMGIGALLNFKAMLAALRRGHFTRAAIEMLNSEWASQVKGRAWRLALQMKSGERSPPPNPPSAPALGQPAAA